MSISSRRIAGALAGALATLTAVAVPVALAAPAATTPPSIRGSVAFGATVSCEPGQWSGGPVSFRYDWIVNGSSRGSGRTFAIDDPYYKGYPLACQVTATDAAGESATASSPGVQPGLGTITVTGVRFRAAKRGRIVVTGKLGPRAVFTRWGGAEVILRRSVPRRRDGAFFQLSASVRAKRDGSFRVVGIDAPGRWAIHLDVIPAAIQLYSAPRVTRTVTVTRGGLGCGGCSVLG
ncbi:hypothetical protein Q5424_12485 [Conexibacter sp. JD483]|uniref:hypothetical protein n=1 Tax=unclassified Conexibacter TaxID=2627773 RepID=UPI0027238D20|nr:MULTISPECIES: hypothetical protein [unclassified Conexibacter]MDO8185770.1 hypothetical protein [Conexibacter sp. CPCC 205706]MDO8199147.1 hypothetical protein [Conexibacter sp. CPCC 205762]MDR9369908.1 hypothetical protein [Conexibacter sp. JD483]